MAIDIQYATESFRKYLTSYDSTDDKNLSENCAYFFSKKSQ